METCVLGSRVETCYNQTNLLRRVDKIQEHKLRGWEIEIHVSHLTVNSLQKLPRAASSRECVSAKKALLSTYLMSAYLILEFTICGTTGTIPV